jgi:hypothetical protein
VPRARAIATSVNSFGGSTTLARAAAKIAGTPRSRATIERSRSCLGAKSRFISASIAPPGRPA